MSYVSSVSMSMFSNMVYVSGSLLPLGVVLVYVRNDCDNMFISNNDHNEYFDGKKG